jgi:hypothetical protein
MQQHLNSNTAHPEHQATCSKAFNEGNFMKKEFKDLILPIPNSSNYMRFDQLVVMLKNHGVQEKTIEQIYTEIVSENMP